jgi:hypothetical protein
VPDLKVRPTYDADTGSSHATRACVVALLVLVHPATALACPVCFQMTDSAEAQGVRAAVFVLVGVTIGVLAGVGTFILRAWRRMNTAGDMLISRDEGRS